MVALDVGPKALATAEAIAEEASARLLAAYGRPVATAAKTTRSDLVTALDLECERLTRERLAAAFPDHQVVGEEEGGDPEAAGPVWFVDPLDGTTNFAHGHPWFCFSLGLWVDGDPVCGVVQAPAMGLTFRALRGQGATRNGTPIRVSSTQELEDALLCTGFGSRRATEEQNNYREFATLDATTHGVRRCAAAALELAHVACGGYDGFWDRKLAPWDLAAGAICLLEAGGRITLADGGPFRLAGESIVATNGVLHDPLLHALAELRSAHRRVAVP